MKNTVIFMYSGQGSQFYNMGYNLFRSNEVFHQELVDLDELFYEKLGYSVLKKLYDQSKGYRHLFHDIAFSHCAIFMVEYGVTRLLKNKGINPDGVWGCSLGEFVALTAAGVLSLEDTIDVITYQTKSLKKQEKKESCMVAVLDHVSLFPKMKEVGEVELAAVNCEDHFVISGMPEEIIKVNTYLKEHKIFSQKLPVNFPFHSSKMDEMKSSYQDSFAHIKLKQPEILMISGINGLLLTEVEPEYLWNIIRQPVNVMKASDTISKLGRITYIDAGTSGTMAGFMKKNLVKEKEKDVHMIITPFGNDMNNLENLMRVMDGLT